VLSISLKFVFQSRRERSLSAKLRRSRSTRWRGRVAYRFCRFAASLRSAFGGEADMNQQARLAGLVESDPIGTSPLVHLQRAYAILLAQVPFKGRQ
jgi:hypothetical protein